MRGFNDKQRVVFISAERVERTEEENEKSILALSQDLDERGFRYKQSLGCYKGEPESSFVVAIDNNKDLSTLAGLGRKYGQESIMIIDENREAFLRGLEENARAFKIGKLVCLPEHEARQRDGWTYDLETEAFFSVI